MKTTILLACIALGGCNGSNQGYSDDGGAFWGALAGIGLGMATYQPPTTPTYTTNCTTFGQMGHGYSCTTR